MKKQHTRSKSKGNNLDVPQNDNLSASGKKSIPGANSSQRLRESTDDRRNLSKKKSAIKQKEEDLVIPYQVHIESNDADIEKDPELKNLIPRLRRQ